VLVLFKWAFLSVFFIANPARNDCLKCPYSLNNDFGKGKYRE